MTDKELYDYLLELKDTDEEFYNGNGLHQAIYIYKDLVFYGGFYEGIRTLDHNSLIDADLSENISLEVLMEKGTIIVPETETYISDVEIDDLSDFTRLPLNNNHIVGGY